MRILKVADKEYKIPERDFKTLLARFDLENTSEDNWNGRIRLPCICPRGMVFNCYDCCLGPKTINCVTIMKKITRLRKPPSLSFTSDSIVWAKNSKASRTYIDTVHSVLLELREESDDSTNSGT